ncbi:MAG: divergent polysaccharide deacetylase family protein [Candidatus Baltobacteraceae bacterium]
MPVFIALALLAGVTWTIVPRAHHPGKRYAYRVHGASPRPAATPLPSPSAQASPGATFAPSVSSTAAAATPAKLAIIIDDCGQWPGIERALIALPIPITLSVMPHVRYTAQIAAEASGAGKGVMLHLPMEPLSHKRSGEGEIETAMSDDAVDAQTQDDLAQVPLAAGVNNHEGSAASADARVMAHVLSVVKQHGLFFIDSRTNKATVGAALAQADGIPNASRDVFLDNEADTAYTEAMLLHAAGVAQRKGSAIAIGHPKPTTLAALRALYAQLQARGIVFVLAGDLVR